MIERSNTYIWKNGEYKLYATGTGLVKFVGGAPVGIKRADYTGWGPEQGPPFYVYGADSVFVNGCDSLTKYIGVAYHSYDYCHSRNDLVTVIYPPAELVIFKGWGDYYRITQWAEELNPFGLNSDDTYSPFDESKTYEAGDILTVGTKTVGADTYAVWTPATTTGTYPAKVTSVQEVGGRIFLRILLGTFIK